jgi:cobalt-precorrin 5A hydrolase
MARTAVIAITKRGIDVARKIKEKAPEVEIYAQAKHRDAASDVNWFDEPTTKIVGNAFKTYDALICIFSLGAVIRLIAPYLADKKSDPAVLVIDDRATYVISALSGHIGGGNELARRVAGLLGAQPVITTAADVNETIAVDLVGRDKGWEIENLDNVTKVSAMMVNEEKIAIYQDAGEKNWWNRPLPRNVIVVDEPDRIKDSEFKGALVISDRVIADPEILQKSVVYRPKSLVVGIGLHWDTPKEAIESGVDAVFRENGLATKSIRNICSIDRGSAAEGLAAFASAKGIPVQTFGRSELAQVEVPNPSQTVQRFEGTASVSEAASLLSSKGVLVVPKVKFPPNLTIAVSRVRFPQG